MCQSAKSAKSAKSTKSTKSAKSANSAKSAKSTKSTKSTVSQTKADYSRPYSILISAVLPASTMPLFVKYTIKNSKPKILILSDENQVSLNNGLLHKSNSLFTPGDNHSTFHGWEGLSPNIKCDLWSN